MSERKYANFPRQDAGEQASPKWEKKQEEKTGGRKKHSMHKGAREWQEEAEDASKDARS